MLTVFLNEKDGSLVDGTSAQLTCLKVVTEDSKDAPSMSSRNLRGSSSACCSPVQYSLLDQAEEFV